MILFSSFLPKEILWNNDNKVANKINHGSNSKESMLFGIKSNLFFQFSKKVNLITGFDIKQSDNIYDYQQVEAKSHFSKKIKHQGIDYSIYANILYHPIDKLSLQTGIRFEDQKYIKSDLTQLSPSATLRYKFNSNYSLAFSLGSYFLPDNVIDLPSYKYKLTVTKAKHYSLSFRNKLSKNSALIIEPYIKTSSPRHNFIFSKGKRIKLEEGETKGIDFTYKKPTRYSHIHLVIPL